MSDMYKTGLVCVVMLSYLCSSVLAADHSEEKNIWMKQLFSNSSAEADQAAIHLFTDAHISIEKLLEYRSSVEPYNGSFLSHPAMSVLEERAPTIGMVCLYLVEAIRRGDLFFGYRFYPGTPSKVRGAENDAAMQQLVANAYKTWWDKIQKLEDKNERRHAIYDLEPLEGLDVSWYPSSGGWRRPKTSR